MVIGKELRFMVVSVDEATFSIPIFMVFANAARIRDLSSCSAMLRSTLRGQRLREFDYRKRVGENY